MIDRDIRNFMKAQLGITDEELDKVSPGYAKMISATPELLKWKIIAEVTESEYCIHDCQVGDKLIFSGHAVNPKESTCPLCLGALAPLIDRLHIMWDRIFDGRDPNELWVRYSQCYDAGLKHGGLGRVLFKVYAEKI